MDDARMTADGHLLARCRPTPLLLAAVLLTVSSPEARAETPPTGGEAPSLAVFPLEAATGVSESTAKVLTETLVVEVRNAKAFARVVSAREIEAIIAIERQREMLGCTDSSCMSEIAGSLGVDYVLVGSVAKLGDSFLLNARLMNCRTAVTTASDSRRLKGSTEETLLDALNPTVMKLLADANLAPGGGRAGEAATPTVAAAPPASEQAAPPNASLSPRTTAPAVPSSPEKGEAPSRGGSLPLLAGGGAAIGAAAVAGAAALLMLGGVVVLQVGWRAPSPDGPLRDLTYAQRLYAVYGGSAALAAGALIGVVVALGAAVLGGLALTRGLVGRE